MLISVEFIQQYSLQISFSSLNDFINAYKEKW